MSDRYSARINVIGETQRDRYIHRIHDRIIRRIVDNPSYKPTAKINGVEAGLVINSSTQEYYKEWEALPDQEIYAGSYVDWGNGKWLVVTCSTDDEIYKSGHMWECNWLFKWQNAKGEIIERWGFASSASKYNEGVEDGKVMTLGSDQCKAYLPLDDEVLAVSKVKEPRFFIDNLKTGQRTVYVLHNHANVYHTFDVQGEEGVHGVTDWILKEDTYTPTEEDLLYGVCGYFDPATLILEDTSGESFDNLTATITGSDVLKISKEKTYTITFYDGDGNVITDNPWFVHWWKVDCDFVEDVEQSPYVDGFTFTIKVSDEKYVDDYLKLQVIVDDLVVAEKTIQVKSLYS